jgi:tetratricopeptide (TPR) repeat protein
VAIILLFALLFKPWDIQIQPDLKAYAENRLTVFHFTNTIDPKDEQELGKIITDLLITDLAESNYIKVMSSQRLADILKMMDYSDSLPVNREMISSVAKKANAKWILSGSILQMEPKIILTSRIIDAHSGEIISSQRVTGTTADDLFATVDKLSSEVKKDLSLPKEALDETDPLIADITTNSPQAYRYYLKGIDNFQKMYRDKAIADFERALEFDSTFAMVYYFLADLKEDSLIFKAVEYADESSKLSRRYINAYKICMQDDNELCESCLIDLTEQYPEEKFAFYLLANFYLRTGDHNKSINAYKQALVIDPLYKLAYNQLVYAYGAIDDLENALWAIDKYIEIAPEEANPYDTKGDLYAANGMLTNAIEAYKRALEIRNDNYASLLSLGMMYLYKTDYQKADSCFMILEKQGSEAYKRGVALYYVYLLTRQGKFTEALAQADEFCLQFPSSCYSFCFLKAQIYMGLKDGDRAVAEMENVIRDYSERFPNDKVSYRYMYAQVLAESGQIKKALDIAEELKNHDKSEGQIYYEYALGAIAMAEENYTQAAMHIENVKSGDTRFFIRYLLAKAYLFSDRLDEAVEEFENIIKAFTHDRAYFVIWSVDAHYYLGLSYEMLGDSERAAEQYEVFLRIWQNADQITDEMEDAKQRLNRLKIKS